MKVRLDGLEWNIIVELCELELQLGVEVGLVRHYGMIALSTSYHCRRQHILGFSTTARYSNLVLDNG